MAKTTTKKRVGERGQENIKNEENLKILRERLFKLTENYTCSELEKKTNVSDSSIKAITNGKRPNPKIDNLISIAKGIPLSIDYITGITPYNSIELEEREICDYLGISEIALRNLKLLLSDNRYSKIVNSFLEDHDCLLETIDEFDYFLSYLPTEEELDTLRRNEKDEILLRRMNKSLINHKNRKKETIESMKKHLNDINKKIESIDKLLKKYDIPNVKEAYEHEKEEVKEFIELITKKAELIVRENDLKVIITTNDSEENNNGKK